MEVARRARTIHDFLASMSIFSSTIADFMEKQLKESLDEELTVAQFKLLNLVDKTNAESLNQVAAFLGISSPAASKAVERLVQRKLINRAEHPLDRRHVELTLTQRGKTLLDTYEKVQEQALEGLFRAIDLKDFNSGAKFLDKLSIDMLETDSDAKELCFRCGVFFRDRCLLRELKGQQCHVDVHQQELIRRRTPAHEK